MDDELTAGEIANLTLSGTTIRIGRTIEGDVWVQMDDALEPTHISRTETALLIASLQVAMSDI